MPLCYVSLAATSFHAEERRVLVRATDAIRLCSDGLYQREEGAQTSLRLDQFHRGSMIALRQFLLHSRPSGFPIFSLDDTQLLTLLRHELNACNVVVLREGDGGPASDSTVEQRRLVRKIETRTDRRLSYAGRQYRLVADADLAKLPDRDSYEVVPHRDAASILDSLAKQSGDGSSQLAELLGKARDKLTPDWRPPLRPDGLILLRRNISPLGMPNLEPALTPSQIKKLAGKAEWIEIEVVDELGNRYTGPYRIERPDGTLVEGRFDEEEIWGDYDIDPGNCKLSLPEVREVKPGAGTGQKTWIWVELVDEEGTPLTGGDFSLKLTDGSEETGITGEDEICYDPIDPGTCELSLDPVGCGVEVSDDAPIPEDPAGSAEDFLDGPLPEQDVPALGDDPPSPPELPTLPAVVAAQVLDVILTDDQGQPLAKQAFAADFGGGVVKEGETDEAGCIHLEDCPADQCTITFLQSDAKA